MKTVILIGGFIEVIELCEDCGYKILGIVDSNYNMEYKGLPILGTDSDLVKMFEKYHSIPLIISPDTPNVREHLFEYYSKNGFRFETLISSKATVSQSAAIGEGCLIQTGCNISSEVVLERGVHVNTGANIMHESYIGKYTTVAPNAVILGRCIIEKNVYIGANSTVLPSHRIEENSIVGAGAVDTKDVNQNIVVAGNPARLMKE